jgi:hypothetical protein
MITILIHGGLANQLFQILAALEYSYNTNNNLVLAKNLIHENKHQHNNKELTLSTIKQLFPKIEIIDYLDTTNFYKYNENGCFNYKAININNNNDEKKIQNIFLEGYFISGKYFSEKVVQDCLFKTNYESNYAIKQYKDMTNNFENTYFIHIRLGDYVNNYIYNINLVPYYIYCINKIKEQNILAKFIICTNEYGTNLDNYVNTFPKNIDYIIQDLNNDAIDTLYIMSSCYGGICSNSTLSWMGLYFQKQNRHINKDYCFMPYPWVKFINNYNHNTIKDVYPEWVQIYNTFSNLLINV